MAKIYPPLCSTVMRLVQGQLKTSNHLCFYMFINFRALARHPFFFLLISYPLLTWASLFLHLLLLSLICFFTLLYSVQSACIFAERVRPPPNPNECPDYDTNSDTIWLRWWGSSNAKALGNVEYPFIVITSRSTLSQGGRTWKSLIYGSNRTVWHLNWVQANATC